MRKITENAVDSFNAARTFKQDNTEVKVFTGFLPDSPLTVHLLLHGNLIAKRAEGLLHITNAGWFSNTTKERLNGLPGVSIRQKKGVWYLSGELWDGEWIGINAV